MQITNEAADIINHYLDSVSETISTIEDAVQLNKEFNNQFDINRYYNYWYEPNSIHALWETLYESILLWWFNYFDDKLWEYKRYINHWYYDYRYKHDNWELQRHIDSLTTEEQLQLMDDPICNYFIHKLNLDIKI